MHISEMWCTLPNCIKVAKYCSVNCLRQSAPLLKSSECVNLHGACEKYVHDVHNSYSCFE